MGWDNEVGIVTHGLDSPGIESWWGVRFFVPTQTGPGAHPASYTLGTRSFLGVKWLRHDIDHPPLSTTEVKEREDLYISSPSGPSWPDLG